jgi:WD40 repeat protein
MQRSLTRLAVVFATIALAARPGLAHHRQTPPIVQLTTTGDSSLPRLPTPSRRWVAIAVPTPPNTWVIRLSPWFPPIIEDPIATIGDNENPAVSLAGRVIAWDTDNDPAGTGNPGRQIVMDRAGTLIAGPSDPTGTSANPTLDTIGERVAFESNGDLAQTGNPGARQIFAMRPDRSIEQVSRGVGTSLHPSISGRKELIAFDSTSDPATGLDTLVSQVWLGGLDRVVPPLWPITHGLGPSTKPVLSDDGQVVAFESRADLAGTGADTGTPQVFIYHVRSATWAQITDDVGGCTDAAVQHLHDDWRVTFTCGGTAQFYLLAADERFLVQTPGGDTPRINPGPAVHFVLVSTTADLANGTGTTPGHQIYMVNLFKRQPQIVADAPKAVWFPRRGIRPR